MYHNELRVATSIFTNTNFKDIEKYIITCPSPENDNLKKTGDHMSAKKHA
jgi:hypothetical protein